jgi:hypothetical protein
MPPRPQNQRSHHTSYRLICVDRQRALRGRVILDDECIENSQPMRIYAKLPCQRREYLLLQCCVEDTQSVREFMKIHVCGRHRVVAPGIPALELVCSCLERQLISATHLVAGDAYLHWSAYRI